MIKEVVWKICRHSYRTNDDRLKNRSQQGFNLLDFELHFVKKAFVLLLQWSRTRAIPCISLLYSSTSTYKSRPRLNSFKFLSRTVSKEGPNKGRPFYCCAKPRGQGCDFFDWGDSPVSSAASNTFKAGRSAPTNSGATKKRKCGLCHQEGRGFFKKFCLCKILATNINNIIKLL